MYIFHFFFQFAEVYKEAIKPNEPITIHIFVKRPLRESPPSSSTTSPSQTTRCSHQQREQPQSPPHSEEDEGNSSSSEGEEELHYHGALFHEDEIGDLKNVFEKKKGEDNKISFSDLYRFLKAYWKWLGDNNMQGNHPFNRRIILLMERKN